MSDKFILQGHDPVPVADLMEWAKWFAMADRRVADTEVGALRVSTVFLGVDYSFGVGPPLIFETMTFDALGHELSMARYSTWAEAELGHMEEVERLGGGL